MYRGRARPPLVIGLVALAVLAAGCEAAGEDEAGSEHEAFEPVVGDLPEPEAVPEGPQPILSGIFTAGPGAERKLEGTAQASALAGPVGAVTNAGFSLHVRLEGLAPGPHAWHIHEDDCAGAGPIVVAFTPTAGHEPVAGAEPIVPGADGVAQQRVTVGGDVLTFEQLHAGEYSIRVHRGAQGGPVVACASL